VQQNPYVIEMNRSNRNCYSFEYLVRNCRNRRTGNRIRKERRLEYGENNGQRRIEGGNGQQNLNGE